MTDELIKFELLELNAECVLSLLASSEACLDRGSACERTGRFEGWLVARGPWF